MIFRKRYEITYQDEQRKEGLVVHIIGIAIRVAKRAPMHELFEAEVTVGAGLLGDFRGGGGGKRKRQVTVLSAAQWKEACTELGIELPWYTRRANLCIEGLEKCGPENVGRLLSLGSEVVLEITGETDPCKRMDEAHPGLKDALMPEWRGGYTCRVRHGGHLALGDSIVLE
jgi:MOSC domain-containing protein YiiM